jgi:hypothetical protein
MNGTQWYILYYERYTVVHTVFIAVKSHNPSVNDEPYARWLLNFSVLTKLFVTINHPTCRTILMLNQLHKWIKVNLDFAIQ